MGFEGVREVNLKSDLTTSRVSVRRLEKEKRLNEKKCFMTGTEGNGRKIPFPMRFSKHFFSHSWE